MATVKVVNSGRWRSETGNTPITIAARKFLRLFDYLSRIDLDVDAIADAVNLSPARIAELPPGEGLPARQYSRLYKQAVVQMQTLNQPVPWGAGVGSEAFELMCHCMISGRTLREALHLAGRFESLLYPLISHKVLLIEEGDLARFGYFIKVPGDESDLVPQEWDRADYTDTVARASGLLTWHALCGWLVGQSLEASEVNISAPHVTDEYQEGLRRVFRCPIQFDTEVNEMVFSAEQLDRRLVHTADSLREFLDNAVYVWKKSPDLRPKLLKGLRADTLILIGGHTDVCVHYTFVDGHQHDYFCRVVEDCVAGSSLEAHEAALNAMEYLQTGARRSSAAVKAAFREFASDAEAPGRR